MGAKPQLGHAFHAAIKVIASPSLDTFHLHVVLHTQFISSLLFPRPANLHRRRPVLAPCRVGQILRRVTVDESLS